MILFDAIGKLKNGQLIKAGDVVKADCGPYTTFSKVIDDNGEFKIFGPGPWCFLVSIHHFEKEGNYVTRVSQLYVYKFCKKNGWDSLKEMLKFKQCS